MIREIHYFSTELKTKIDVIPRSCFKSQLLRMKRVFKHQALQMFGLKILIEYE